MTIKEYKIICAMFGYAKDAITIDLEDEDLTNKDKCVQLHLDTLKENIHILVDEEKEDMVNGNGTK